MSTPSLAEAIGLNVRKLRLANDVTLEAVATACRKRGLKWDNTRVANFEAGRVPPNLNTLVPLALALSDCFATSIALSELLVSDQAIRINEVLAVGSKTLAGWSEGRPISAPAQLIGGIDLRMKTPTESHVISDTELKQVHRRERALVASALAESGISESRASSSLGITPLELAVLSVRLWGRSFAAERDHRAPNGTSAQGRGQISRQLKSELKAELDNGDR